LRALRKRKPQETQAQQPIMVATASTEHSYWLALAFVILLREIFTQQTQAPANRNARSKQWQL